MSEKKTPKIALSRINRGKHLGHAVEAHARGILRNLALDHSCKVDRTATPEFPVHPDAVIWSPDEKIRSIILISYSSDDDRGKKSSDNSSLKFYRHRFEYTVALTERKLSDRLFHPRFIPVILIYGTIGGWKRDLVNSLKNNYPVTIFLPDYVQEKNLSQSTEQLLELYIGHGSSYTEDYYSLSKNHGQFDRQVKSLLNKAIFKSDGPKLLSSAKTFAISPSKSQLAPFQSRVRQNLALLNLFPVKEILAYWDNHQYSLKNINDINAIEFIKRACFLDMCTVHPVRRVSSRSPDDLRMRVELRRPIDEKGDYAPHMPDFSTWISFDRSKTTDLLNNLSSLPIANSKTFAGGGLDQAMGNYRQFIKAARRLRKWITDSKRVLSPEPLQNGLQHEAPDIGSVSNSDVGSSFKYCGSWSIAVATLALISRDRTVFRDFSMRLSRTPDKSLAAELADALFRNERNSGEPARLISNCIDWCDALSNEEWMQISQLERPELLAWSNSTSWTAWWYGTITTNPSYNPLSIIARNVLESRYPQRSYMGFPSVRSVALSRICPNTTENLQWNLVAQRGDEIVFAEPRTITKNNLGNKSKEVFDRISNSRLSCIDEEIDAYFLGILDGDFLDRQILDEFTGRYGYSELIRADEYLRG